MTKTEKARMEMVVKELFAMRKCDKCPQCFFSINYILETLDGRTPIPRKP
jgi:hypothetical protein